MQVFHAAAQRGGPPLRVVVDVVTRGVVPAQAVSGEDVLAVPELRREAAAQVLAAPHRDNGPIPETLEGRTPAAAQS